MSNKILQRESDKMEIIISEEIQRAIKCELGKSQDSVEIISAFAKVSTLHLFEEYINHTVKRKRILVRLRKQDLLSEATDLEIYTYCKENNWEMYFQLDLHAKTFIFDDKRCIVGSANLTNRGMSIDNDGNIEFACMTELDVADQNRIETIFQDATKMTDMIYDKMLNELKNGEDKSEGENLEWSDDITNLMKPSYQVLFTYEFPQYPNIQYYKGKCIDFLGLQSDWTMNQVHKQFQRCKSYMWLKNLVQGNNGEVYFGYITSCLHNTLMNDPKPYRKDVKEILSNLLEWIVELEISELEVDRPNYSQRVRIRKTVDEPNKEYILE